ncbi:phage-shock protein [Marinitoga sp. 1197]|uniref:PspC domain-containing protein n=1 Tax=Marinitoga sp. 1197 TaxID=1428449 RepID=UPI0006414688|nr:PspC domain-containing protein [Marinitoga sp. 1197]KLO21088.1 phage-shock protein [Marinitoga sp. 1197]
MEKEIYRSRKDRFVGGVCGGIANYFNISSTLVRLLYFGLILADGIGIILYIIAWIIIPEEPINKTVEKEDKNSEQNNFYKKHSERNNFFIGLFFITIGIIFVIKNFFPDLISLSLFFGIIFLIFGLYLLMKRGR